MPLPNSIASGKSEKLASFEFYNLKEDVKQDRDLAGALPEKAKELSDLLVKKDGEVQAAGPAWSE